MIVQVTSSIRIRAEDGSNYTIERRKVSSGKKSKGQEYWETLGYHGSLESAVRSLLTNRVDLLIDERSGVPSKKLQLKLNHVTKAIKDLEEAILTKLEEKGAIRTHDVVQR